MRRAIFSNLAFHGLLALDGSWSGCGCGFLAAFLAVHVRAIFIVSDTSSSGWVRFSRLGLGSFEGLVADRDEHGEGGR